jgi:hypothetical protein
MYHSACSGGPFGPYGHLTWCSAELRRHPVVAIYTCTYLTRCVTHCMRRWHRAHLSFQPHLLGCRKHLRTAAPQNACVRGRVGNAVCGCVHSILGGRGYSFGGTARQGGRTETQSCAKASASGQPTISHFGPQLHSSASCGNSTRPWLARSRCTTSTIKLWPNGTAHGFAADCLREKIARSRPAPADFAPS